MRYFAAFEGIGGFSRGIEEGYERFSEDLSIPEREQQGRDVETQPRANDGGKHVATQRPSCIGVSEIDRFASAIYKYHYPNHQNYGDATQLICESIPDFDLLTGGFPCQAFSIAGKRQGFNEARGTLFFEIARILSHKRPRYFLLENVKGLLSHDSGKTYLRIIGILADLGYFVETIVLNSKDFGVPQNRERIFFIGHLAESGRSIRQVLPFGKDDEVDKQMDRQQPQISGALKRAMAKGGNRQDANSRLLVKEPDLIQVGNLYDNKAEGGRGYSPEGVSRQLQANGGGIGAKTGLYVVPEATKQGYAIAEPGDSINLAVPNSKTRRGRVGKGVANTLETSCNQATVQGHRIRRLTPIECERLQAFPDEWSRFGLMENGEIKEMSDSARYKCLGNAVTVSVIAWLMERILIHAEGSET